jgi:hypothetical protein
LDPGAPVDGAAGADNRCASRVRGAIACLTLGAGHGLFTDQWTGHGPTSNRYVTFEPRS